jgi:hypothetical protein
MEPCVSHIQSKDSTTNIYAYIPNNAIKFYTDVLGFVPILSIPKADCF